MNRFKTDIDGGLTLRLDDFRWIYEANKEALTGIVKALIGSETGCKLYGCEVVDTESGDFYTCSEGFVYFNGEIFYVAPCAVERPSGTVLFFQEVLSYDAAGNKVFKLTGAHDTYEIRRATLVAAASIPSGKLAHNAGTAADMFNLLVNAWQSWTLNVFAVTADAGALSLISGTLRYLVTGKKMVIKIHLDVTINTANATSYLNISLPYPASTAGASGLAFLIDEYGDADYNKLYVVEPVNGLGLKIRPLFGGYINNDSLRLNGEITIELQ